MTKSGAVWAYALAVAACLLALTLVLKLWDANLHVPFSYYRDSLLNGMWVKSVIDGGWFFHNSFLGAPQGLSMLDYPMGDNLHFLLIKAIALFTSNYAVVMNLFFLVTFPLATISAMFVFRRLGISYPLAAMGGLLFAFLPYHFFRGEIHLLLAAIYIIPLTGLAAIRLASERPPFLRTSKSGKEVYDFRSLRSAGYLAIALLTGSSGIYYAVFACFFLMVAGLYAALDRKSLQRLAAAVIMTVAVAIVLFINVSPSIVHDIKYGRNAEVAQRLPIESEIFGVTIGQLVLPITGHRLGFLAAIKDEFARGAGIMGATRFYMNENDWSSLGFIGSIGFVISLGWLIFIRRPFSRLLNTLGVLNISGILLATSGGFSLVIALLFSPQIRAYNRISVYIGFFSILVVLVLMEKLRRKYFQGYRRRLVFLGILAVLLTAGILDQTSSSMVPDYQGIGKAYASDEAFVKKIEAVMPAQTQVFQLPYVAFPENPPVNKMADYDHLRPYLHSHFIRWSYGASKGRDGDLWQRGVAAEPADRFVNDLVAAGFNGIYINRDGYQDSAAQIEKQLEDILNVKPIVNDDNTLLFFDMRSYIQQTRSGSAGRSGA